MTTANPTNATLASSSYAALRHGGAPPGRARAQLGLKPVDAVRLERLFQAQRGGKGDAMRPRFARHEAHVAAVLSEGGFPAVKAARR